MLRRGVVRVVAVAVPGAWLSSVHHRDAAGVRRVYKRFALQQIYSPLLLLGAGVATLSNPRFEASQSVTVLDPRDRFASQLSKKKGGRAPRYVIPTAHNKTLVLRIGASCSRVVMCEPLELSQHCCYSRGFLPLAVTRGQEMCCLAVLALRHNAVQSWSCLLSGVAEAGARVDQRLDQSTCPCSSLVRRS